jgi:hypothetical protein
LELETVNKLFLELSQFATATTAKELKLQSEIEGLKNNQLTQDKKCILEVLLYDSEQGWGEISSGLTSDHVTGTNSFNVRYKDGSEYRISFRVSEI